MEDIRRSFIVPIYDMIIKTDSEESGGLLVHNNLDYGIGGGIITKGGIRLIKHALLGTRILSIGETIEKVSTELDITQVEKEAFSNAMISFVNENPLLKISSQIPEAQPVISSEILLTNKIQIPGSRGIDTESGILTSRTIEGRTVNYNVTNMRIPKDTGLIFAEPFMLGAPKLELNERFDTKKAVLQISPNLRRGARFRRFVKGEVEHPACGSCGVCGLCVFCAEVNYAVAVNSALAVIALY